MGYKVIYGNEKQGKRKKMGFRCFLLTMAFFVLFLQIVSNFWPEGEEVLQNLLFAGDTSRTKEAIQTFSQELSSGFSLSDAAKNFWQAVFHDGYAG